MAKSGINIDAQCRQIISDVRSGVFKPVYLLMGDEPYYPELVCQAIIDNCLQDNERDFNQIICYGSQTNAEQIIGAARRFPMMAQRQLVVLKEAQACKSIDELAIYCSQALESTVLVILFYKAAADKRKALYKAVSKIGVVVDSPALRDYELPNWIISYYKSKGLSIDPRAASLLAESVGTDLSTIVVATDKLLKNLPENVKTVSVEDVEKNVGVSRQFSIFELTKELSYRNSAKALKIAAYLGSSAKFAMPMAVSALYTHYNRILRYSALLSSGKSFSEADKAAALPGLNPYFYKEYDAAVRNYSLKSAMSAISLLCEYDYLGKGGDGAAASPEQLLMELVSRLLNV